MQNTKQLILILFFFVSCALIISYSGSMSYIGDDLQDEQKKNPNNSAHEDSFFTGINFYLLSNNLPFLNLNATELTINSSEKKNIFFNPEGYGFSSKREKIHYRGKRGRFYQNSSQIFLEEDVTLKTKNSTVNSNYLSYDQKNDNLISTGDVKTKSLSEKTGDRVLVDADEVEGHPNQNKFKYLNNVKGQIIRKRVYEEGMTFSSDILFLDMNESHVELEGDVTLNKNNLSAKSRRGEIFLENYNKRLKYYALFDDVKVSEQLLLKNGEKVFRKSFSEKLEGVVSEDKIILTGYPKVIQEEDVIKGNKIVLRENNEVVEVDDASTYFILR